MPATLICGKQLTCMAGYTFPTHQHPCKPTLRANNSHLTQIDLNTCNAYAATTRPMHMPHAEDAQAAPDASSANICVHQGAPHVLTTAGTAQTAKSYTIAAACVYKPTQQHGHQQCTAHRCWNLMLCTAQALTACGRSTRNQTVTPNSHAHNWCSAKMVPLRCGNRCQSRQQLSDCRVQKRNNTSGTHRFLLLLLRHSCALRIQPPCLLRRRQQAGCAAGSTSTAAAQSLLLLLLSRSCALPIQPQQLHPRQQAGCAARLAVPSACPCKQQQQGTLQHPDSSP